MVRPLRVLPNPTLRTPAASVAEFDGALHRLVRDMIDTMYANDGIGLAAPQIGCSLQIFVANPSQTRGKELVIINPSLEDSSGRAMIMEGCLSVPDVWAKVRRASRVRLRGRDVTGASHVIEADGLLAIVLQHELDHLHGQLFIDHLSWWRRQAAMRRKRR